MTDNKTTLTKKTCHQCWQYAQFCESCQLGHCYWFNRQKSPICAEECEAFNSRREGRKHRDENGEIFPLVEEFYDFLQGKSQPEGFHLTHNKPKLTAEKAFTVIYIMQEYLHILPESFEKCKGCDGLFDSDCEGYLLDDQYKLNGKTLPKKYRGHWCENCAPEVDFECP